MILNPPHDQVSGAAISGHRLALTGTSNCVDCPGQGFLAMVDVEAAAGARTDFRRLNHPLSGGPPIPTSLTDAIPAPDSSFWLAGHTRTPETAIDPQVRNRTQFLMLRVAPDRLFGDGLE